MTKQRLTHTAPQRGLTLLEVLLAMTMSAILITAVVSTFVFILRTSEASQAALDAGANARAAIETLSRDIKGVREWPGLSLFVGQNNALTYGDGVDNDLDGAVDEEQPDGADTDGDWQVGRDDRHAALGVLRDRPGFVGLPDLGDTHVDEDCVFHHDRLHLRLITFDRPDSIFEEIVYEVREHDGRPNVLMRDSVRVTFPDGDRIVTSAPIAFDVLSFNCLYWNANGALGNHYWRETWDSALVGSGYEIPAAVWVELTVYADTKPIEDYNGGDPVETRALQTTIALEDVIQDAGYPRRP